MRLRRHAGREDRRGGAALRGEGSRCYAQRGGGDRALQEPAYGLQGAEAGALPRRLAEVERGQDPAQGSARDPIGESMAIPNYSMATAPGFVGQELGASDWV